MTSETIFASDLTLIHCLQWLGYYSTPWYYNMNPEREEIYQNNSCWVLKISVPFHMRSESTIVGLMGLPIPPTRLSVLMMHRMILQLFSGTGSRFFYKKQVRWNKAATVQDAFCVLTPWRDHFIQSQTTPSMTSQSDQIKNCLPPLFTIKCYI